MFFGRKKNILFFANTPIFVAIFVLCLAMDRPLDRQLGEGRHTGGGGGTYFLGHFFRGNFPSSNGHFHDFGGGSEPLPGWFGAVMQ